MAKKPKGHKTACKCPFCARIRKKRRTAPKKPRATLTKRAAPKRRKRSVRANTPAFGIVKLNARESQLIRNGQSLVIKDHRGRVLKAVRA